MTERVPRSSIVASLVLCASLALGALPLKPGDVRAQTVEDGSDAVIGKADTEAVLDLVRRRLDSPDAKVASLRRREGSVICGTVDVRNREGLYTGERGFLADLSKASFGRVPDGPELLNPRTDGFEEKERIRLQYFQTCLD